MMGSQLIRFNHVDAIYCSGNSIGRLIQVLFRVEIISRTKQNIINVEKFSLFVKLILEIDMTIDTSNRITEIDKADGKKNTPMRKI